MQAQKEAILSEQGFMALEDINCYLLPSNSVNELS